MQEVHYWLIRKDIDSFFSADEVRLEGIYFQDITMYLVFLMYALFASVFTISKTVLQYAQPLFIVGTRMTLAGILILFYLVVFKKQSFKLSKGCIFRLLALSLFCIYLTNMFEFWGLQHLTSFKTCFIYSLSPFLSALFSYFLFSERMNWGKWAGLLLGFAGFFPILMNESTGEAELGHLLFVSWAEIFVVSAVVCSVYGWILLRKIVKEDGLSPLMANGISMLLGGLMALTHSWFRENWDPAPFTEFMPFLECSLWLILISNLICYNLYGYLLKKFTATFISLAGFTTPLFTAFFGWLYLGEQVTASFYISAAIVFCGLVVFYLQELKQGYYLVPEKK